MLVKSSLYASVGIVFSVLLFRRRPWPAFVGFGLGAGRAWEECDNVCYIVWAKSLMLIAITLVVQECCSTIKGRHANDETLTDHVVETRPSHQIVDEVTMVRHGSA